MTEEEPASQPEADTTPQVEPQQLPPAHFSTIVSIFATQAMVALGLFPGPDEQSTNKQLPVAKQLIDILSVLEEKTKNNLTQHEAAGLESTLHQLRMVYLEALKKSEQSPKE